MKFINNTSDLENYLSKPFPKNKKINHISIDSRKIKPNSLFIALKGNDVDGNNFVEDALSKGAVSCIVDNTKFKKSKDCRIIYVKNSVTALKTISENIIKQYKGNVIAITGSNGKTTTTNIAHETLNSSSKTIANYNNEIGMPISLMSASKKSKNLILEIGASKLNDIDYLSKILAPNVGVITNIGMSHLKKLKDINGVLKVKSELVNNVRSGGTLIVPSENMKHLQHWEKMRDDLKILTFGFSKNSDFFPTNIHHYKNRMTFKIRSKFETFNLTIDCPMEGEHNIKNVLASFAIHYALNQDIHNFSNKIKKSNLKTIRQIKSKWINGSTLIDDTYNANPDSTQKSIDLLSKYKNRTIFIIGDMLELGKSSLKLHSDIGKYAKLKGIDLLIGYGNHTKETVSSFGEKAIFFDDKYELKNFIKNNISKKDVILIKGSRGMRMEKFKDV